MFNSPWLGGFALAAGVLLHGDFASAGTLTTLYAFTGGTDGGAPASALISGPNGSLYGTTALGGQFPNSKGYGTVFQLSPPVGGTGGWTVTTLYTFQGARDGKYPQGIVVGSSGAIYGVTTQGGQFQGSCKTDGCGAVFKLAPPAHGQAAWGFRTLYTFQNANDGANPAYGLAIDRSENLYGAASRGGYGSAGTVFQLAAPQGGEKDWNLHVLYSFTGGADGGIPLGGLLLDSAGNIFGTTYAGGPAETLVCTETTAGCGTVFELIPPSVEGDVWTHKVILSFKGSNGNQPISGLTQDENGNIYGSTFAGGHQGASALCGESGSGPGCGVLFEVSPPSQGKVRWTDTTLFKFKGGAAGNLPFDAPVVVGGLGFVTSSGQDRENFGKIDAFAVAGQNRTRVQVKAGFSFKNDENGAQPEGALLPQNGVLYGTTAGVGTGAAPWGTVFQYTP